MASLPPPKDAIIMASLASVDDRVFNAFERNFEDFRQTNLSRSLLRTNMPSALETFCSSSRFNQDPDYQWNAVHGSTAMTSLGVFPHRRQIVEEIQKYDVTVVMSPTGSGKSLMGPMLLAELLHGSGRTRLPRGLTVCPSSAHATNIVKESEKMYMTSRFAHCNIVNFVDPYDQPESFLDRQEDGSTEQYSNGRRHQRDKPEGGVPHHAVSTHRGALNAIKGSIRLDLLVIDEAHSTTPDLPLLLAFARKLLHSKNVAKVVLATATLTTDEFNHLGRYFAERDLTLGFYEVYEGKRIHPLRMSCPRLAAGGWYDGRRCKTREFVATPLSRALTEDFRADKELTNHLPSEMEEDLMPFAWEMGVFNPEMNFLLPYMKQAVDRAMRLCREELERRRRYNSRAAMPSILVIVPGKEHLERIMASVENFDEEKQAYEYQCYMYNRKPAFILQRLKSKTAKTEKKLSEDERNDEALMELRRIARKKKEEETRGEWGGQMGMITFATPTAAEGMTLEDVAFVIDAGMQKVCSRYSPTGLQSHQLVWIDERMLYQRAGRCGRTTAGEYFLCADPARTATILASDIKNDLFDSNFDEQAWFRAKYSELFDQLIVTPKDDVAKQMEKSFTIRGAWKNGEFSKEASLLHSYFPFLAPEHARFVVMGVRLGLAAHVICFVADAIVSHKLCGRPTKIPKNYEAISDEKAYDSYVNVCALSQGRNNREKQIRPYCMGDSVARADMTVTWLRHTFPTKNVELEPNFDKYEKYDDAAWKQMEIRAITHPDGYFWSGHWLMGKKENKDKPIGMKQLQQLFVRDDGREAVCGAVAQITRVCQRLGLITPPSPEQGGRVVNTLMDDDYVAACKEDDDSQIRRGSFLSPQYNDYLIADNNYNLNEDGRALFRALLTMNSDKLARMCTVYYKDKIGDWIGVRDRFEINATGYDKSRIFPNRHDWTVRENKSKAELVRFWNGFKAMHAKTFIGSLDPLTTAQAAFFTNISGMASIEAEHFKIYLNASPMGHQNGIFIPMKRELAERVWKIRVQMQTATAILLRSGGDSFARQANIGRALIDLWQALDDGAEKKIDILSDWKHKVDCRFELVHSMGVPITKRKIVRRNQWRQQVHH